MLLGTSGVTPSNSGRASRCPKIARQSAVMCDGARGELIARTTSCSYAGEHTVREP
jgi:hypothetical protein